jgi:hypothetical protein
MKWLKILAMAVFLIALFSGITDAGVSGSASVDVMSNYVWRGFKLSDGVVIQPSVGIIYGGFGANLWSNYDTDLGEHNETDLTLNYSFSVEGFSLDAGYIYYALEGAEDTQEIYLSVGYDTLLNPVVTLYYDFDEGDGAFITASIGHDFELSEGIQLSIGASASYNLKNEYSIGDFSNFHNGELSLSVSFPLRKNITVAPMMACSFPLSDDAEYAIEAISDDSRIFYGGINLSLNF